MSLIIFFESTTYTILLELLLFVGVDMFIEGGGMSEGISIDKINGGVDKDDLQYV